MKRITQFFLLCSGIHMEFLRQCPSETSKCAGLGAAIFFTGVFAFLSAAFAFFTVFDNYFIATSLGLIWGLMIFNLDRYIVSSMRKEGRASKELLSAMPRLLVAIVISLVIAKPLELRIFQKEIEPELTVMEQQAYARQEQEVRERFTQREVSLRGEIVALQGQIREKQQTRDELDRIAREEADGTGGSRRRNLGPIYKIKKADADRASAELEALSAETSAKINELENKIAENDSLRQANLASLTFAERNGLAARMEALSRVKAQSPPIWWAGFAIMLLLIVLETVPVLVKLIAPRGPYDNLLKAEEFRFTCQETEELARASAGTRNQAANMPEEERVFIKERLEQALKKN